MYSEFLAQIAQAGSVGIFGRERFAFGYAIEFNDAPATEIDRMERRKDGWKIDAAFAELDPFVAFVACWTAHIFEVHEENSVAVFANGGSGISATLQVVRDVELKVQVVGI